MSTDELTTTIFLALAVVAGLEPTDLVAEFSVNADLDALGRLFWMHFLDNRVAGHLGIQLTDTRSM